MNKWRKIETEGLPEEMTQVLWYRKPAYYKIGHLYDENVTWEDRWVPIGAFTHWMPLPKPPKE